MALNLSEAVEKPYAFVENQRAEGQNRLSYLSKLIETNGDTPEDIDRNKWSAASLYGGGSDTVGPKTIPLIHGMVRTMTMGTA